MSPDDIKNSFEARAHAVEELRRLVEDSEGAEFSAEQQAEYDRQNDAIDALDSRIRGGLDDLNREKRANDAMDEFSAYGDLTSVPETAKAEDGTVDENELFRQLVNGEIRSFESQITEKRDLTKGTDSAGGYTVDSTMFDRIFEKLEAESAVIRAGATVIRTEGGEDLIVPGVQTNPTAAITNEAAAISEADAVFKATTLGAWRYASLTQVSDELIEDSSFDIVGFVSDIGGAACSRALGADLSNGSGSSKPKGVAQAATSFGTSATATTITADNLIEVVYTMPTPYLNTDTAFIMSPGAAKLIRKLTDSNGSFVFEPNMQLGQPDNLLGYRMYLDSNMDAPTSGKRAVTFAHMPSYMVRIAGGLRVDTSADYAFNQSVVTVKMQLRGDGDGIDLNGIGCLTQA